MGGKVLVLEQGYSRLSCKLIALATESVQQIESDSPELVVSAILNLEFLGGIIAEVFFDGTPYDQEWALEKISYKSKLAVAIKRMDESDVSVVLDKRCQEIVRHARGRPNTRVADMGQLRIEHLRRNLQCALKSNGWPYSPPQ